MRFCNTKGDTVVYDPDDEFLAERDKWYKILEDDDEYTDIEQWDKLPNHLDVPNLKSKLQIHRCPANTREEIEYFTDHVDEGRLDYYQLAGQYLWEPKAFKTRLFRDVWNLHCEGLKAREIVDSRKKRGCVHKCRSVIDSYIKKMREEMFAKYLNWETEDE